MVEHTAALLVNLGHCVQEIPAGVSPSFVEDFADYWSFLAFLVHRFGHRRFGEHFDASRLDGLTRGLVKRFHRRSWRTPLALFRLHRSFQYRDKMGREFDLVLSPVLGHATPPLGYLSPDLPFNELFRRLKQYVSFTPINNASGGPAIALPMGAAANGLPIGIQFSASLGQERTLLEIAYELEQARPWRRITDG